MAAEVPNSILDASVFGDFSPNVTSSVHHHNLSGVIQDANQSIRGGIGSHYNLRGGAYDSSKPQVGIVVSSRTSEIDAHADYVASVLHRSRTGHEYVVVTFGELARRANKSTVVAPYFNSAEEQRKIDKTGQLTYGLPPQLVDMFNNKAHFHKLVESLAIRGLTVPEFKTARLDDEFVGKAQEVLDESKNLYSTYSHSLPGKYPLGLMFRTSVSSGLYGSARALELDDGSIQVDLYGKNKITKRFPSGEWGVALQYVQSGIDANTTATHDPEVVISRYIDVADSPGLAFFINEGTIMPLRWNRQIMPKGDTSCKGTSAFFTNDTTIQAMQDEYEEMSQDMAAVLITEAVKQTDIPLNSVTGTLSFDLMLPGKLEQALMRARGKKMYPYFAECNARFTNWTRGLLEAHGIISANKTEKSDKVPSVANLRAVADFGVESTDVFPLHGADPNDFRDLVYSADEKLAKEGKARAFIPMIDDNSAGILLLGNPHIGYNVLASARDSILRRAA